MAESGNILREMFVKIGVIGDKKSKRKMGVFRRSLKAVVGDIQTFQANLAAIGVSSAFSLLTQGVRGLTSAFKGLVKESSSLAAEQEKQENSLRSAMEVAGDFSEASFAGLKNFASAMQNATVHGDELLLSQLSLAKGYGATNQQAQELVSASADMAAALNKSLPEATALAAKTLGGYAGELSELIPAVKELTQEQLKAGGAIKLIAKEFKGRAAREVRTFTGALNQLNNVIGDMKEKIGGPLNKVLVPIFIRMKNALLTMQPIFTKFGEKLAMVAKIFDRMFAGMGGQDMFGTFITDFGDFLVTVGLLVEDFFKLMRGEKSAIGAFLNIDEGAGFGDIFDGMFRGAVDKFVEGLLWFIGEVTPRLISGTADMLGGWVSSMATDIGNLDFLDVLTGAGMSHLDSLAAEKQAPGYAGQTTSNNDYSTKDIKIYNTIRTNQPVGPMTEQMQILGEKLKNGEISL